MRTFDGALRFAPLIAGVCMLGVRHIVRLRQVAAQRRLRCMECIDTQHKVKLPIVVHESVSKSKLKPGRLIIVGDVHGCAAELQQLLQQVQYTQEQDNLIFVGDLVNKGPKSIEVLDMFLKLGALGVRGNHDDAALYRWHQWSQHQQELGERHAWLADLKPEHVRLLEQLPYTLTLPDYGIIIVHAGLVPGLQLHHQSPAAMSKMRNLLSLHEPVWSVPLGALGAFATAVTPLCLVQCEFNMADVIKTDDLAANVMMLMFLPMLLPVYWGALMATAAVSVLWAGLVMAAWCQYEIGEETEETQQYVAQARYVALEKVKDGGRAWAGLWRGPEHVFFGHDATRKLQLHAHATGLDDGCCYGNRLCAAVVRPLAAQQCAGRRGWRGAAEGFVRMLRGRKAITREDLQVEIVSVQAVEMYDVPRVLKLQLAGERP